MSFIPKPHEIYKHFKGNLYQIVTMAQHSETGEQMVVYQALYGDFETYVRPLEMFLSPVDRVKYPEVTQEFRFELQGADSERQKREIAGDCSGENIAKTAAEAVAKTATETATEIATEAAAETVAKTAAETVAETVAMTAAETATEASPQSAVRGNEAEEELQLDPMVLEFLDADSYEQRLNILAGIHHRVTDDMITTMAIACDIEVEEGDTEQRYESLKSCLLTLEKYECNRLR